jgi:ABC-type bacteriocin/lantibiotic exporter with double-glycine peptidase domain
MPGILKRQRRLRVVASNFNAGIVESIQNIFMTKIFCREDDEVHRLRESNDEFIEENLKVLVFEEKVKAALSNAMSVMPLVVVGFGSLLIVRGDFTLGSLLAFLNYTRNLTKPAKGLVGLGTALVRAKVPFERLEELVSIPSEPPVPRASRRSLRSPITRVQLRGIHVDYGALSILQGIDLDLRRGEPVVLTGSSGCGKTTLLNTVSGLVPYQKGSISVDGKMIGAHEATCLRSHICYLSQSLHVLHGSVASNLFCTDRERIASALECVGLSEWYASLPEGIETPIWEAGRNMSEGQKQRLGIARGLLRGGDIWLMDEISSALDAATEAKIMELLFATTTNKVVLCVAHRPRTWSYFPRRVDMIEGRAIERVPAANPA